jgi:hypothetical protein
MTAAAAISRGCCGRLRGGDVPAPRLIGVGSQRAVPIAYQSDGAVLLFNRDELATVYLGDEGIAPGDADVHVLDPLGTLSLDGSRDWWGITDSAAALVQSTPGATNSTPSAAAIAGQIALSGISSPVPQLIAAPVLVGGVGVSFGPTVYTFPTGAAYQLVLTANTPSNACWADIRIEHLDSLGTSIYEEDYSVGLGSLGNFSPVIVRGNLCGRQLRISGTVATGAQINALPFGNGPFTGTGLIMGVYAIAQALSPPTPKIIPCNTTAGILQGFQAISLGAGASSIVVPMFTYMGRAKWDAFSATAGNARGSIQFFKVSSAATPQSVLRIQNDGKVSMWEEIEMLGMLAGFQVTNQGAATANITGHVFAAEYI